MTDSAERDARWMDRALRAAGGDRPGPYPRAAALLVRGETLLAGASGRNPLEAALARAGGRARGATLYVTLEPRDPDGAPSRSQQLLEAGVARVVVGCADPAAEGKRSLRRLRAAKVEVVLGVGRVRAEQLVADYAKFRREGLPFVTLKAAVTLDGRLAARSGESKWITGEPARREAHRMRAASDAVLVGVGTVLADDPELNVRLVRGRDPLRVVLDSELRTPLRSKLVRSARQIGTLLLHAPAASPRRAAALAAAGVELAAVPRRRGHASGLQLAAALRVLAARGVIRLLVEGGSRVHGALLEAGLVDAVAVFLAPRILGDAQARPLAFGDKAVRLGDAWTIATPEIRRLGRDVLVRGVLERRGR